MGGRVAVEVPDAVRLTLLSMSTSFFFCSSSMRDALLARAHGRVEVWPWGSSGDQQLLGQLADPHLLVGQRRAQVDILLFEDVLAVRADVGVLETGAS